MSDRGLPQVIRPVVRAIDALTAASAVLATLALASIFGLILAEVVARNFVGTSIDFSWDYASYMMGAVFMLAAGAALRSGTHVRVTAVRDVFGARSRRWLDLAACLVGLAVIGLLLWSIGSMAWLSAERGSTSATVAKTPLWIPQSVMTFGAFVFLLQMIAQTLRVLGGRTLDGEDAGEPGGDG